jgi:predicted lactoylglutathione lyase
MANNDTRSIYINLAVKDLAKTKEFFGKLGFDFNPQFTDDKAACMIVNDKVYVMLLTEPFFATFTKKEICRTASHTETLLTLSFDSKAEVDEFVTKALAAGGTNAMPPMDHGFMYGQSFYDLDGHHWELFWMDPNAEMPLAGTSPA